MSSIGDNFRERLATEVCTFCYLNRVAWTEARLPDTPGGQPKQWTTALKPKDLPDPFAVECVCGPEQRCRDTLCEYGFTPVGRPRKDLEKVSTRAGDPENRGDLT